MNSIDLSVIIPVFNAENDLMELFESLKNQKNLFMKSLQLMMAQQIKAKSY